MRLNAMFGNYMHIYFYGNIHMLAESNISNNNLEQFYTQVSISGPGPVVSIMKDYFQSFVCRYGQHFPTSVELQ